MPHHKQTAKRLRKSLQERAQNRGAKSEMRTLSKRVREAVAATEAPEQVQARLRQAISTIDRLAKRRVIKPGAAARRKSRLARLVNKAAAATAAPPPEQATQ